MRQLLSKYWDYVFDYSEIHQVMAILKAAVGKPASRGLAQMTKESQRCVCAPLITHTRKMVQIPNTPRLRKYPPIITKTKKDAQKNGAS
jgi:hypothetical protein